MIRVLFFLDHLNFSILLDARAVFERSITSIPDENAKEIWNKMFDYENRFGDFSVIDSLNKRRTEKYEQSKFLFFKIFKLCFLPLKMFVNILLKA